MWSGHVIIDLREPVSKKCLMHLFIITFSFGRVEMNDMVLEWFFEYSKINILPL